MIDVVERVRKGILPLEDIKSFSRDFLNALLERAGKHKDSLLDAASSEFSKFLAKINVHEEVRKILEGMTINFEASIYYKDKNKPITHVKRRKKK